MAPAARVPLEEDTAELALRLHRNRVVALAVPEVRKQALIELVSQVDNLDESDRSELLIRAVPLLSCGELDCESLALALSLCGLCLHKGMGFCLEGPGHLAVLEDAAQAVTKENLCQQLRERWYCALILLYWVARDGVAGVPPKAVADLIVSNKSKLFFFAKQSDLCETSDDFFKCVPLEIGWVWLAGPLFVLACAIGLGAVQADKLAQSWQPIALLMLLAFCSWMRQREAVYAPVQKNIREVRAFLERRPKDCSCNRCSLLPVATNVVFPPLSDDELSVPTTARAEVLDPVAEEGPAEVGQPAVSEPEPHQIMDVIEHLRACGLLNEAEGAEGPQGEVGDVLQIGIPEVLLECLENLCKEVDQEKACTVNWEFVNSVVKSARAKAPVVVPPVPSP